MYLDLKIIIADNDLLIAATAVAVGTANFVNPTAAADVLSGIRKYLRDREIDDVRHIVGQVEA